MQLCLVRHAIAVDRGTPGLADEARPLTDEGRARMEQAAAGLARLIPGDAIYTSPYLRALQTAEILAEAFRVPLVRRTDALATGDDEELFRLAGEAGESVLAVGHQPYISGTLSYALTGDALAFSSRFKKGAAALVSFEHEPRGGTGTLEALLQPGNLRALAAS